MSLEIQITCLEIDQYGLFQEGKECKLTFLFYFFPAALAEGRPMYSEAVLFLDMGKGTRGQWELAGGCVLKVA